MKNKSNSLLTILRMTLKLKTNNERIYKFFPYLTAIRVSFLRSSVFNQLRYFVIVVVMSSYF